MEIYSYSHSSIPIPILLFPLPFPFPWESHGTHEIPIVPIPMHISTAVILTGMSVVRMDDDLLGVKVPVLHVVNVEQSAHQTAHSLVYRRLSTHIATTRHCMAVTADTICGPHAT